jgi:hypothetical protein
MRFLALLPVVALAAATPLPVAAASSVHAAAQLPTTRLEFGLANGPADLGWMTGSGVPWKYRYQYLAGGVNTANPWEKWQDPALPPGQFAVDYMSSSQTNGYIPVFTWYELLQSNPSTGANESDRDFNNLNNATTMNAYFASFKTLMSKAGAFGKQVVVHIEPDFWGYMQGRTTGDASTVSASVASSGFADASGYPNTVQGFGQALLHMRDLYAPSAVMAVHASPWSNGGDIGMSTSPGMNAVAIADATAAFLMSAGNWDAVFNDLDDHDAGWWETQGRNHWWDPTNATFPNFTRYLDWVAELKAKTGKQQVAWQVPVGNQYFLTMNNTCGHYQDNVAPYFIAHPSDLVAAGLVAVMFGAGNACQTTYTDAQKDGVTNNGAGANPGPPTSDAWGWCNACNTRTSVWPDDDGGYLRTFVGQYYVAVSCAATPALSTSYLNWYDNASPGVVQDNIHILNPGTSASSGCVTVSGSAGVSWTAAAGQETYVKLPPGTIGGPVVIAVNSGPAVKASQRVQYNQSFNEVWAASSAQAATTSFLNWYDKASAGMLNDNVHLLNPGTASASVTVSLPGATQTVSVAAGAETYVMFPQGTIGGPVKVTSSVPVLASQRVQYNQTFNEVWAASATLAATMSFLNWYDKASEGMANDNIHLLNPGTVSANVTVSLPGATQTVALAAGAETYVNFPGTVGGPVTVTSTQPVLSAQRVQFNQSFNEVWAAGPPQAAATSYFNWYDKASAGMLNDNIHLLNPSGTSATVTVSLPGASPRVVTVAAGAETYVSFPGSLGGPVSVSSTQPVLASQRVQYYQTFNEIWAG